MVHVPYRGAAAAYPDLMTGKVHVLFDNITGVIKAVQSGNLRGLGVTTPTRWPSLPNVPAIAETVPGFEATIWYGIFAPKGTPPEIVDVLNKAVNAALADHNLLARFETLQGLPMPMSSRAFGEFVSDDVEVAQSRRVCRSVDRIEPDFTPGRSLAERGEQGPSGNQIAHVRAFRKPIADRR